jgi:hypothetical protein
MLLQYRRKKAMRLDSTRSLNLEGMANTVIETVLELRMSKNRIARILSNLL